MAAPSQGYTVLVVLPSLASLPGSTRTANGAHECMAGSGADQGRSAVRRFSTAVM